MKEVEIKVTVDGTPFTITSKFEGETMPEILDRFIKEHIGGRPDDRK